MLEKLEIMENITQLIFQDSLLLSSHMEDNPNEINLNFLHPDELDLITRFYRNYNQFDMEDSIKLINIFHRFEFKQTSDFANLTIIKYGIDDADVIEKLENINLGTLDFYREFPVFESYCSDIFEIACSDGFFLTVKYFYETSDISDEDFNLGFINACSNGHLEIAQWIFEIHEISENIKIASLESSANKPEIIEWLLSVYQYTDTKKALTFKWACILDSVESAIILLSFLNGGDVKIFNIFNDAFLESCRQNYLLTGNSIKWLLQSGKITEENKNIGYDLLEEKYPDITVYLLKHRLLITNETLPKAFILCCKYNLLYLMKWLYNNNYNNNYSNNYDNYNFEKCFISSCKAGNKDVAEWLASLNKDSRHFSHAMFLSLCRDRNFKDIEWLYDILKVDHDIFKWVIVSISQEDNYETFKKLLNLDVIDRNSISENIFLSACKNGDIETAKTVIFTGKYSKTTKRDLFLNLCKGSEFENLDLIEWIYNFLEIDNQTFLHALIEQVKRNNYEIVKKMYEINENNGMNFSDLDLCFDISRENGYLELTEFFYELIGFSEEENFKFFIEESQKSNFEMANLFFEKSNITLNDIKPLSRKDLSKKSKQWIFENFFF